MSQRLAGALLIAVAALAAAPAEAEDKAGGNKLQVSLENITENDATTGQFVAHGEFPYLPTGTILHVTLRVLGRTPPIEATVLKIDCTEGGRYRVEYPFEGHVLAPIGYEVRVVLHMEAQPADIKNHLKKELGYRGSDSIPLATLAHHLGTLDERVAFARDTLQTLLSHQQRAGKIFARVDAAKAPAAWEQQKEQIIADFVEAYREYREWYQKFVVLYEHQMKGMVEQCYQGVEQAMMALEASDAATCDRHLGAVRDLLPRIKTDLESRLPTVEQATANPEQAEKAPEKAPEKGKNR